MATKEEADRTLAFHADEVMANPNVTSISVVKNDEGESIIEIGLAASEIAVDRSLPGMEGFSPPIAPNELRIPDASGTLFEGARTIPVQKRIIGKIHAQSFTQRQRPAMGGNSCGPATANWSGTLGARIKVNGVDCILSNWHVLYGGVAKDGDLILQQARGDGGTYPDDVVARNLAGVLNDYLDAALAAIRLPVDDYVAEGTISYGTIMGMAAAAENMCVKKCGRTTEATTGTVRSTNATVRVSGYPDGDRIFKDQLQMTAMSAPGDSGSIVLDNKNQAVGLLFAGGSSDTFANKIERVMAEFAVSF